MAVVLRLLALLLFLIALLTGGCALVFSVVGLLDPAGSAVVPFVLVGFAIGAPCLWGGIALWRNARKRRAVPPEEEFR